MSLKEKDAVLTNYSTNYWNYSESGNAFFEK